MSDTSQGPGWWKASDHKWYPPELYPKDWQSPAAEPAPADVVAESAPTDTAPGGLAPPTAAGPATPLPGRTPVVEAAEAPVAPAEWSAPAVISPEPSAPSEPAAIPVDALGDDWSMPAAGAPLPGEPGAAPGLDPTPVAATEPAVDARPPIDWTAPSAEGPKDVPFHDAMAPPQPEPVADAAIAVEGSPTVVVDRAEISSPAAVPQALPASWDTSAPLRTTATAARTTAPTGTADVPSGILGLVGGAALIGGSFMPWATAGGTLAGGNVNGLTDSNGWGTLIAGLVVAGGGVLAMAAKRRIWVGGAMLVAALVAAGLIIFSILDIGSTSDELPARLLAENVPADVAEGAVLDLDLGIWVVAAGSAIALIAGLMALLRRE